MKKKVLTIGVIFIILVAVVVTAVLLTLTTNYQLMKNDYVVNSKVGQSMEVLGTVPRNIPEQTSNGGLSRYPVYATTLTNMTTEEKQALLDEMPLFVRRHPPMILWTVRATSILMDRQQERSYISIPPRSECTTVMLMMTKSRLLKEFQFHQDRLATT